MAIFRFTARPRKKNSNEPLTYDIEGGGVLVRQKNKWRLRWRGVAAEFDTKHQMQRHFALLGHRVEGIA